MGNRWLKMSILKKIVSLVRKREGLTVAFQLSPAVFWIVFFLLIPLGILLIYSFWNMRAGMLIPEWGFHNYIALFTTREGMYIKLLLRSLGIAVLITVGAIAIAYPVAYFISFRVERYKYSWILLMMGPYLVSWVILILGWRLTLGYTGLLNYFAQAVGLIQEPMRGMWGNWGTVVFLLIVGWAPFIILPLFVSLEKIDRSVLEAAADLGANSVKRFLKITLPLSSPGLLVATFLVLIPSFGEFVTPTLAGGASGTMYGMAVEYAFTGMLQWPFGSALAVPLMIVTLITATMLIRAIGLQKLMESL